jgi:hypothetical protein
MYNHLKFSDVARICELKTRYSELIEKVTVPSKRKKHNMENAEWFIKSGHVFNKKNVYFKPLLEVCNEIIKLKGNYHAS